VSDWTLFDQALFELAIGRYASGACDACVRAENQRVTELCEGARLGVSDPPAARTGSRRPGQTLGRAGAIAPHNLEFQAARTAGRGDA
jgi:hypothetical protein